MSEIISIKNNESYSASPRGISCPADQEVGIQMNTDTSGSITVTLSPPDTSVSFAQLTGPDHGTATITPAGLSCGWSYTPNTNFTGLDSFIIRSTALPGNTRCPVEISVFVENLELTITKSADKPYVESDDTLTYSLFIKNTGTITSDTAVIKDTLPVLTTLIPNTTYIDGVLTPGADIITGINLAAIPVNGSVKIDFSVAVSGATSGDVLDNVANYTATGLANRQSYSREGTSNNIITPVINSKLDKSVDKLVVLQGDTLEYLISFTNTTGFTLNSAIIKDVIPTSTTLISGTTKVNGTLDTLANVVSGIEVGPLATAAVATVSFQVKVDDNAPVNSIILDTASLDFTVTASGTTVQGTVLSNEVDSTVIEASAKLSMLKAASPKQVVVSDIVKYNLTITNNGKLDATNVLVTDLLAPELSYADNLTVDGVSKTGDITTGVNIGTVKSGTSVIVTFDAKVESIPANMMIKNTSTSTFIYTLPSGTIRNGNSTSNTETIEVFNVNAVMTKKTDTSIVNVGDTFTYTLMIQNTGNVNIVDYILKDPLPSQFQVMQITVDGTIALGDLTTGIALGPIAPMQIVIVKIKILVLSVFSTQVPYLNVATGDIRYLFNGVELTKEITATEPIGILVVMPKLRLEKSSDVDIAVIGDTVTYTIVATNEGTIAFTDVVVRDLLAPELDFIEGSVKIDGVSDLKANILAGVHLGPIAIIASKTLTFKVKIIGAKCDVCNIATADYYYTLDKGITNEYGIQSSNESCICIKNISILVAKVADKSEVSLNDIINYTVTVTNESDSTIDSAVFKDILPISLLLIDGSVTVDGVVVSNPNLALGINIGTLAPKQIVIIKYSAKVIAGSCSRKIKNSAFVESKYSFDNGSVKNIVSNIASVEICSNIAAFKQLSIDKLCPIPPQKPDMEEVNSVFVTGKILKSYVIKTHKGVSNEGQNLSGYKLVVNGVLNIIIEYTANDKSQSIHSYSCDVPFGTFIILPTNYTNCRNVNVDVQIEDVDYETDNCRETFINIMYLVIAKI
ncbi:MAG: DUF7507 domain-containing protein [Clostridium sp.]